VKVGGCPVKVGGMGPQEPELTTVTRGGENSSDRWRKQAGLRFEAARPANRCSGGSLSRRGGQRPRPPPRSPSPDPSPARADAGEGGIEPGLAGGSVARLRPWDDSPPPRCAMDHERLCARGRGGAAMLHGLHVPSPPPYPPKVIQGQILHPGKICRGPPYGRAGGRRAVREVGRAVFVVCACVRVSSGVAPPSGWPEKGVPACGGVCGRGANVGTRGPSRDPEDPLYDASRRPRHA
jgi:hypothetical protein